MIITACGITETAVSAVKAGAADYLTKRLNLDDLLHRVRRVRELREALAETLLEAELLGISECVLRDKLKKYRLS